MSAREWRPGDVATIPFVRRDVRAMRVEGGWILCDDPEGGVRTYDFAGIHPLVAIDPDDCAQLDALCKALVEAMHRAGDRASAANGVHPGTVAAALREFANPKPPKPDEPSDPAARVSCRGAVWARVGDVWVANGFGAMTWERMTHGYDVEVEQP